MPKNVVHLMHQHATGLCASGFIYIVKTKCPKRIAEPESQQFPGEKWLKMTFLWLLVPICQHWGNLNAIILQKSDKIHF